MIKIVGVTYEKDGRINYCKIENIEAKKRYNVIVKNDKGLFFAKIATDIHIIDETKLNYPLDEIYKIATKQDYYTNNNNINDAKDALKKCQNLTKKYNLNMNIVEALYTFDKDQLIFKFYSEERVDFRNLAKELANIYHTRIELRQIGVRDKAKKIGGFGVCGQKLCCSRFLNEFDSVSISMAKNQNLALAPNKINGSCGRLLCCLNYEDSCYKEYRQALPKIGDKIKIKEGAGKVISLNIIKKIYRLQLDNGTIIEVKI